jgi:hypothetical protein
VRRAHSTRRKSGPAAGLGAASYLSCECRCAIDLAALPWHRQNGSTYAPVLCVLSPEVLRPQRAVSVPLPPVSHLLPARAQALWLPRVLLAVAVTVHAMHNSIPASHKRHRFLSCQLYRRVFLIVSCVALWSLGRAALCPARAVSISCWYA